MNVKKAAGLLSNMGRGGDTLLAHINPREAALLKAAGGSGAINPKTGLLEFDDDGGDGGDGGDGDGGDGGDSGRGDGGIGGGLGGFGGFGLGGSGGLGGIGSVGGFGNPGFGGISGFGSGFGNGIGGSGGGQQSRATGFRGYSLNADGTLSGPAGFDSPGFSLSRSNPANNRSGSGDAVSDALSLNDALRQAGAIRGDEFAANNENIFGGNVGNLPGLLGSGLRESLSPRTTGIVSMVKNMFSIPEKVETQYSALNDLISSGYAEPTAEGFKATPKSLLGMFGGVLAQNPAKVDLSTPGGVVGAIAKAPGLVGLMSGNVGAALSGPVGMLDTAVGAIGLANQMQTAGLTPGRSGTSSDSTSATGGGTSGGSVSSAGGGRDFNTFDADAQYASSQESPLVSSLTIDPYAWFASRRGMMG